LLEPDLCAVDRFAECGDEEPREALGLREASSLGRDRFEPEAALAVERPGIRTRPSQRSSRSGSAVSTFGRNVDARPPADWIRTESLAPGRGSPSSFVMNGFQLGKASVSVNVAHTRAGLASISIVLAIWPVMGDLLGTSRKRHRHLEEQPR
jgi:hypothetical protein